MYTQSCPSIFSLPELLHKWASANFCLYYLPFISGQKDSYPETDCVVTLFSTNHTYSNDFGSKVRLLCVTFYTFSRSSPWRQETSYPEARTELRLRWTNPRCWSKKESSKQGLFYSTQFFGEHDSCFQQIPCINTTRPSSAFCFETCDMRGRRSPMTITWIPRSEKPYFRR